MICEISLGGRIGDWAFVDGMRFQRWLARCPWQDQGGLCALRVPGARAASALVEPFRRSVFAADAGGSSRLQVVEVDASDGRSSLRAAIATTLGVSTELPSHEIREAMSELLVHSTHVLLVSPRDEALALRSWDEGRALFDEMSKTPLRPSITIVFMETPRASVGADPTFDLTTGAPLANVLSHAHIDQTSLWQAYAHARMSWECGGNIERALDWSERCPATGDDDALEEMLNSIAEHEAPGITPGISDTLNEHLASLLTRTRDANAERVLLENGLLWQPPGTRTLRVAPWVARYILKCGTDGAARWYLRGCLVCEPLVAEILATCLDLEVRVRAVIGSLTEGPLPDPPAGAQRLYDEFLSGVGAGAHYPRAHPARPDRPEDRWSFATFGEFLKGLDYWRSREARDRLNRLTILRNTLAHGHYVCWQHVKETRSLIQEIESLSVRDLAPGNRLRRA